MADDYGAIGYDEDGYEDEDVGLEELVGLDEIVGDEDEDMLDEIVGGDLDDEIVGALPRRLRGRYVKRTRRQRSKFAQLAHRMKLAREIDPNAVLIKQQRRTKRRRLILPIPKTTVAAGASLTISIAPQNLFKTGRMLIPSNIAFSFDILDVKIGQKPQFVQSGSMPAAVFSEVSVGSYVDFDSADVGNLISIDVRNNSAGPLDFAGILLGTAAK